MADKAKPKRPHGRPTAYTEAIAVEICDRLAAGESLQAICRDEHLPQKPTVLNWAVTDRDGFFDRYKQAREIQAMGWQDEVVEIADNGTNDWMDRQTANGTVRVVDHEHITRSRLRVDTRKWLMAVTIPRLFGDRSEPVSGVTVNIRRFTGDE
jgi:hypothetical protein